ncbi:CPBP family intramembrane glutamic endopeptidase [Zunongwangia profunda]|uniref:Metal-dependent membrane protease n=1 Tax=Zunongwangia profunda (strain DSM 18752 / CCTCC AB 206139 / SM-A87) TaxID=655815 RepID=D5BC76_ZUNPS|nr:CPBP family intramembrane glutamic endopeptidase [Zunongwangia profunda]ADF54702.1 putative metal-dependent membrane protease [Zunongwangia profunda SM-A87]
MKSKLFFFLAGSFIAFASILVNIFLQKLLGLASIYTIGCKDISLLIHPFLSSIATGFFEEVIFRFVLLTFLIKAFKLNWLAILVGSLIFSLVHLGNSYITIIALISHFLGGIIYSYAFVKTKEIWLPFGLHFGWNYTQIFFGIPMSGSAYYSIFVTNFHSLEYLNGGAYGFEGGIWSFYSRVIIFIILLFVTKFSGLNSFLRNK